ncbi:hypothetical protein HUU53_05115, partial [Candidatus Micrarchaeota archaeon]|nr:hypothetical protein [Candidatus Micrarchaeota archaeon]
MMASHLKKREPEPSIDEKLEALKAKRSVDHHPVQTTDKQIQLQFSIPITQNFKAKLPFLVVILILFVFSAVLLDKANFKIVDLLNFARIDSSLGKFYSLGFFLFLLVYSLTLALSIFYGHGISPWLAMLTLPLMIIASIVMGLFFPSLMVPFLALGVVISSGAFFSSLRREVDWGRLWNIADQALLVLVVLAAIIVFAKASANQELYKTSLVNGIVGSVAVDSGVTGSNSTLNIVTGSAVNSALTLDLFKKTFPKASVEKTLKDAYTNVVMTDSQYDKVITGLHTEAGKHSDELAAELNSKLSASSAS